MPRALFIWLAAVAACYRPSPPAGAPCSTAGTCPDPLVCTPQGSCEVAGYDGALPIDARDRADAAVALDGSPDAAPDAGTSSMITWIATTSATIPSNAPLSAVDVPAPMASPGDVMIGVIAMGETGQAQPPAFTPPAGWTEIRELARNNDTGLAVFWHAAASGEPATYTWTFNEAMEGVAWISSYRDVSTTMPVDTDAILLRNSGTTSWTSPSLTTSTANDMIVVSFAGHTTGASTAWQAPNGTTERANVDNGTTRSGLGADELAPLAGLVPGRTAHTSVSQQYALVHVLALRPAN